ncbi:MAG: very short patch repair endonuclease [Melioribacteraceae bacterium]|nr:MAG: very short patch repair endonuclease [Melioribacteraceae bacterium]
MDIVSKNKRSKMMSGIKSKNTRPETLIRKALFSKGFRYRINVTQLPGKPDLVLKKHNAVIFINGCFWHLHNCHLFKWPSSRAEFWKKKITENSNRDKNNIEKLLNNGRRVLIIWECSVKGKTRLVFDDMIDEIESWLNSEQKFKEIEGNN